MKKLIIIVVLATVALAFVSPKVVEFFNKDSCLDGGGRWSIATKSCEYAAQN